MTLTADHVYSLVHLYLLSRFDEPTRTPEFHRELWEYACSPAKYVAIAAPRGFAKSTAITLAYVMASVVFRCKDHVLIVSDTEGQAALFLGDIKREFLENEDLIRDFKIKRLIKDTETEVILEFDNKKQARLVARGSEQKARGLKWRHKRPNLIIGDDLENDEMVMSDDRRVSFRNWFLNALLNSGSRSSLVRIIGTILHFDALLARLMPQTTEATTRVTPLKTYSISITRAWFSVLYRAHPDIDDFSELLWEEMWPQKRLEMERQKYLDENYLEGYSQEYLNNPIDESSAYFKQSDFIEIDKKHLNPVTKEPEEYYAGIDLAISKHDTRAYSVIVVAGLNSQNVLRVRDVRRFRGDGNDIINQMFAVHRRYKPDLMVLEDENISKSLGGIINTRMLEEGIFLNLHLEKPIHDKIRRARSLQARMRTGAVEFDMSQEWYPMLEQELLRFPRGQYSDQVDALAWICFALDKTTPGMTFEEQSDAEYEQEYEDTYLHDAGGDGRSSWTGY